ncbi:MAG TPA: septum formation initiator family protein [Opitutaceae bacterium]|nr:septum formation initiator family protein [Opitutaceae bacterium]
MSLGRFLATLYAVVFLALSAFAGISFMQTYQELGNLRTQESETRQKLQVAEQELREQQRMLEQLRTDPLYVESMIRRKLGYAKQGETVFRFRE